ncbi:hypothetical protein MRX96_031747 [Rhipicephalus microplus]
MIPPPGALPARPVRKPKHKRGASFGGIPFAQLESLSSWTLQESRENIVMAWKTAAAGPAWIYYVYQCPCCCGRGDGHVLVTETSPPSGPQR